MRFLMLVALLAFAAPASAQQSVARTRPRTTSPAVSTNKRPIAAAQAPHHVGEVQTVCGVVTGAEYAPRRRGEPTYLYLDQALTVVIWGSSRSAFPEPPEVAYRGKRVCVTAGIGARRGVAEVVVSGPGELRLSPQSTTTLR